MLLLETVRHLPDTFEFIIPCLSIHFRERLTKVALLPKKAVEKLVFLVIGFRQLQAKPLAFFEFRGYNTKTYLSIEGNEELYE